MPMGVGASGRPRVSSPAGDWALSVWNVVFACWGKHLGVKAPTAGARCLWHPFFLLTSEPGRPPTSPTVKTLDPPSHEASVHLVFCKFKALLGVLPPLSHLGEYLLIVGDPPKKIPV